MTVYAIFAFGCDAPGTYFRTEETAWRAMQRAADKDPSGWSRQNMWLWSYPNRKAADQGPTGSSGRLTKGAVLLGKL